MNTMTIKDIVEEQHGKVTRNDIYLSAIGHADSFFTKLKEQLGKKQYVLFIEKEKLHIYTLNMKKKNDKVTEEVAYALDQLENISITNLGTQEKQQAKIIKFIAPSGEKHSYYIPYKTNLFQHPHQAEHLLDFVEVLMPTE